MKRTGFNAARQAVSLIILGAALHGAPLWAAGPVGLFDDHGDVGKPALAGSVQFDAGRGTYLVTGGGKNMWAREDQFHFIWKRMSGDVTLSANIR